MSDYYNLVRNQMSLGNKGQRKKMKMSIFFCFYIVVTEIPSLFMKSLGAKFWKMNAKQKTSIFLINPSSCFVFYLFIWTSVRHFIK